MARGIEHGLVRLVVLLAGSVPALVLHAQPAASFQCPSRVQAQAAAFNDPSQVQAFSTRFSSVSPAHLLRVTVQQGSGKAASDIKPVVDRQRWQWKLPSDRQEPTTVWCHYEGGIALARVIRPAMTECVAELSGADQGRSGGAGVAAWGLGRVNLSCQ
jgi:hypothetical protein